MNTQHSQYQDYVNALSQAQQYSPAYIEALQQQQAAQLQGQQIQSNFYTGNDLPGDTLPYAQGMTARAQAQNTLQQTAATQQMQVQALIRQGDIAGAQALVQAAQPQNVSPGASMVSPLTGQTTYGGSGAYSDYQAQQTYFNLAQNFPDAQIPAYNPQLSAQQNLQVAQQQASQSPSFQSRNTVQVQLPGGGIGFVNKNQIVTNPTTGQATIIGAAQATAANAASSAVKDLTTQQATTQRAVDTAEANFPLLEAVVKKSGVNDFNAPLANQLQQALNNKYIGSGDMASFNALLTSLQTEYSQIIARGGNVTDQTRAEAAQIVNGNIGYSALQDLYGTLKQESGNVLKGYTDTISKYNDQLNQIYASGQSLTGNTSSSANSATDPLGILSQ